MLSLPPLSAIEAEQRKRTLLRSHLAFTQYFFEVVQGSRFLVGPHHKVMCDALDRVYRGECMRLIICIPPGYSKTELAVINFIAHGFAINPGARFIHASYADTLALDNSSKAREIINLPEFQANWSLTLKADTSAKGLWRTDMEGHLRAAASGQPITGFRAGRILEPGDPWKFTGALIIDDPLKPDDAHSKVTRQFINQRWQNTFRSRFAQDSTTPCIVIMQRLHVDDFVAHILETSGERWDVLMLPIEVDGEEEEIHPMANMIPHGLPDGPLWSVKHNQSQINILKLDELTYSGQYRQRPIAAGGNLFKEEWFNSYENLPRFAWRGIYVDTAQKTEQRHDYSVFEHWGATYDGRAYLIDVLRAKMEAPELEKSGVVFWNKAKQLDPIKHGHLRHMKIEDKVSGTGLIQTLRRKSVPVIPVQREKDKYMRALDIVPSVAAGLVYVPRNAGFTKPFINEVMEFPDGIHDDQVDPFVDAVLDICGGGAYSLANVG